MLNDEIIHSKIVYGIPTFLLKLFALLITNSINFKTKRKPQGSVTIIARNDPNLYKYTIAPRQRTFAQLTSEEFDNFTPFVFIVGFIWDFILRNH